MTESKTMRLRQRRDSTSHERIVMALEDIAEQIRSAVDYFKSSDFDGNEVVDSTVLELDDVEIWENEGGKFLTNSGLPTGIMRQVVEVFVVGTYRYNRFEDAIAKLRREHV